MHALPAGRSATLRSFLFLSVVSGFASLAAGAGFDAHRLWTVHGGEPGAVFGSAVASGDVNGDGHRDIIVGAPLAITGAGTPDGKVFAYYGSPGGLPPSPAWTADGEHGYYLTSRFGSSLAVADVNGDGFDDVMIGAHSYDPPEYPLRNAGRIYAYYGSEQGLPSTPSFVAQGWGFDLGFAEGLGYGLTTGDFNGDGYADVAASTYSVYVGGAAVYYGSASGLSAERSWILNGMWALYNLGESVSAGDFNADGYDDLIVTATADIYASPIMPWQSLVYLGSASGLPPGPPDFPTRVPPSLTFTDWLTSRSVGDLDGDGVDDILALELENAYENFHNFPAYVPYSGTTEGPRPGKAAGAALADPYRGQYGTIYPIGDLNGDGFADVIAVDLASFFLYFGSASGLDPLSNGMGPLPAGPFASAGDVDGDGIDDLIAGSSERADVYRGGTDWSFPVTADVAVQKTAAEGGGWSQLTVTNAGPDTVRVRLFDPVPPALAGAQWTCLFYGASGAAAPRCELPPLPTGDLDSPVTIVPGGQLTFEINASVLSQPVVDIAYLILPEWMTDPDLSNNQAMTVSGPPVELLFFDNFESGDLSAWSSHSGAVAVVPSAALQGGYGLEATAPGTGSAVVRDDSPADEGDYHARFLFDPKGFGLPETAHRAAGRDFRAILFSGHGPDPGLSLFEIELERKQGLLSLRARAFLRDGTSRESPPVPIADTRHLIEVAWKRSGGPAANDGLLQLRLDGSDAALLSGLTNDVGGVDHVELGLVVIVDGKLPARFRRTVVFDAFESWRPGMGILSGRFPSQPATPARGQE